MSKVVSSRRVFGGVALTALAALAAFGPAPASAQDPITIGVAMRTETQPRWQFDLASMQARADELGATLIVQWANDDPVRQASQVENLLSQDVDAIIIIPVDDRAAASLADKADEADVPVITYDIGIQDAPVDFYLTRDNAEVGRLQVQGALDFAPPNAGDPPKYVLIKGDPDNNVARDIAAVYEEMLKPLADAGEIVLVADQWHENWSGEAALETAENALTAQDDDIDAFITSNDSMAIGVVQALEGAGIAGKAYVSGLDADVANDRLIVEGSISRSIWTRIDLMGARAVDAAVALAKGETPASDGTVNNGYGDVPAAFIDVMAVTKDNMCDWINNIAPKGWVTAADIYVDTAAPDGCK